MRDIKFRAWDKLSKQMIGCYMAGLNMDFTNGQIYAGSMNVTDKVELMQYTGLKDRNGKEIYEDDIVKFGDFDRVVIFENGSFSLAIIKMLFSHIPLCNCNLKKVETIGNIYENPELLDSQ